MPTIVSRPALASAAGLLFAATLIIVVDVRLPAFDVVADVIGGVLVLVGCAAHPRRAAWGRCDARRLWSHWRSWRCR